MSSLKWDTHQMLYLAPLFFQKKTTNLDSHPYGPAVEIIPEHSKHVESYSRIASGTPAPSLAQERGWGLPMFPQASPVPGMEPQIQ